MTPSPINKLRCLYGCETLSLTLTEKRRMKLYENRVFRKLFGTKRDQVTWERRYPHYDELNYLYSTRILCRWRNRDGWNGQSMWLLCWCRGCWRRNLRERGQWEIKTLMEINIMEDHQVEGGRRGDGVSLLRIGTGVWLLLARREIFEFHNCGEILD